MKHITRHRDRMSGQPCITGTRITTALIRRWWEDGADIPQIAAEYPHLSSGQIMAALAYERTVRRRVERWTARRVLRAAELSERAGVWLRDWSERWV